MEFEAIKNFRDLGGIPTKDGRVIKSGLFFRSAMLDDASDADIKSISDLKIANIFDYRDKSEAIYNDRDVYALISANHRQYPVGLNNDKLYKLQKERKVTAALKGVSIEDVKMTYRHLPFNNEGYKAMVGAMQSGALPLWQHCSAGKDRAGMGSALVLCILGVEYEEILKDYLKSNAIKDYIRDKIGSHIPRLVRNFVLKKMEPLFIVDAELLAAAKLAIKEKYSTLDNYLLAEYGLTKDDICDLRARYTEAAKV